jgi:hypothetical protein
MTEPTEEESESALIGFGRTRPSPKAAKKSSGMPRNKNCATHKSSLCARLTISE